MFTPDEPRIGVVLGTGPSLTRDDVMLAYSNGLRLFGVNSTLFDFPLDVHLACNVEWFDHFCDAHREYHIPKWIVVDDVQPERAQCAERHDLKTIKGRWLPGISTDEEYIHYHHGAGPQAVNLAYHYGCRVILLLGWDMRYGDRRHYFGEYPPPLLHFPRTGPNGELAGLIREMETIAEQAPKIGLKVINCTPGSAMRCFPMMSLQSALNRFT